MKSNKVFLLVAILVVFAGFVALAVLNRPSAPQTNAPGAVNNELLVRSYSPVKGKPDAPVTVVEFLDPECESCRAMHPIVLKLLEEYDGKIKVVIRYMPFHGNSRFAAAALEEAREQGKFDQALDALFERQPEWGDHHNPNPDLIVTILEGVGVNKNMLGRTHLLTKHGSKIEQDNQDGTQLGVRGTPTFFVNGVMLENIGYGPVKEAIEKALAK